ncbi:unnamed protein product [Lupinus luteus]|uniref:Uncharacterized protein n=1 Tax=Lupinus luteus TaxID=3873 RepID=A0AAV1XHW4_LUPLU
MEKLSLYLLAKDVGETVSLGSKLCKLGKQVLKAWQTSLETLACKPLKKLGEEAKMACEL